MNKIGVVGFGSWGTALAVHLANKGHEVTVTSRNSDQLKMCEQTRENAKYLKGITLPGEMNFTEDIKIAVAGKDVVLFAVPAQHFRKTYELAIRYMNKGTIVVNSAKGIERGTLMRLSEVAGEIAPEFDYVTISGPSHAEEVARKMPTSVVSASSNINAAIEVQSVFMDERFRVYTNKDICGVEIAGSLKNIIALGAGISDGIGFGDNAKAAMMTRGILEIARLGIKLGASRETFAGLAGIGDLIATCTSMHSRNRRCGYMIGEGMSTKDAIEKVEMVVEGISTCYATCNLAKRVGVDMPITQMIKECLDEKVTPFDAVSLLMTRSPKDESEF